MFPICFPTKHQPFLDVESPILREASSKCSKFVTFGLSGFPSSHATLWHTKDLPQELGLGGSKWCTQLSHHSHHKF